jgi:DNA (cytosine-5)-methyltransferase 1
MSNKLTLGSLFDGSGGFPLGALLTGIEPIWAAEVEPFPIRVTTKRLPDVRHYGDVNKINGYEVPAVDIITAGFCCQDLSLAGKRAGLRGERSGIFFQITRIIREMREATAGKYPKIAVLENVAGMYSSNRGYDFLEILNELIKIKDPALSVPFTPTGRWTTAGEIVGNDYSLAWRTFDAQFWGVAQRRRRCYLVIDFTGFCAGEILFDETRLCGNPPQGGFTWETTACDVTGRTGESNSILGDPVSVLNDQGGSVMHISENVVNTLRADADGHAPIIFGSAGFCTEHSADSRGVGYEDEKSPTLRAGVVPGVAVENHPGDSRIKINDDGIVQTLSERMGTGGGNVPLVMNERQYALTVSEDVANTLTSTDYKGTQCVFEPKTLNIRQGKPEGGGKGPLIQNNLSATLSTHNTQTVFVPTAYGITAQESNSMRSSNPHSGVYEAATSKTLDVAGIHPGCRQGGIAIIEPIAYSIDSLGSNAMKSGNPDSGCREAEIAETITTIGTTPGGRGGNAVLCMEGNAMRPSHRGKGVGEDVSFTLNTVERHAVSYGIDRSAFNQGQNALFSPQITEESASTLVARGPSAVCNNYIVRRLTPTECALLQGFPPDWCSELEIPDPSEADIKLWSDIWETHRLIVGKSTKPKSRKQIIKWLKSPHSDSAEYKMWGNGVALPCVIFVLGGVAHYMG